MDEEVLEEEIELLVFCFFGKPRPQGGDANPDFITKKPSYKDLVKSRNKKNYAVTTCIQTKENSLLSKSIATLTTPRSC